MSLVATSLCLQFERRYSFVLAIAVLMLGAITSSAAERNSALENGSSRDLNLGFTQLSFRSVNRNDAETAIKVCFITIGKNRGYNIIPQSEVFDTVPALEQAIRSDSLHVVVIPTWDYLSMDVDEFTDPYFVAADDEDVLEDNILLARREDGVSRLSDLRGKSVVILESASATSTKPWFETLLLDQELGKPEEFFGRVELVHKVSSAVLPVFFGKYQACVVDRSAFETMSDLNPQIAQRLQVVASSEPLAGAVFCLQKKGWTSVRAKQDLIESLAALHSELAGQQLLTLFKVRKLVPFKPEYLDSMKRLRATQDRLAVSAPKRARGLVSPSTGRSEP